MNTLFNYCGPFRLETDYCKHLENYIQDNLQWVEDQIEKESNSTYWHQVFDRHASHQTRRQANEKLQVLWFDCPTVSSPRCVWHCCSWKVWRIATMNSCPFHGDASHSIRSASCKEEKLNFHIDRKQLWTSVDFLLLFYIFHSDSSSWVGIWKTWNLL